MTHSAFFSALPTSAVTTRALILADGAAGAASVVNAPDLVTANTESYTVSAGSLDVVASAPAPARGSGCLRSRTGGAATQQWVGSQFTAFNARTTAWTFELWGQWNQWPDLAGAPLTLGGLHNHSYSDRSSGWKLGVSDSSIGTGLTLALEPVTVGGDTDVDSGWPSVGNAGDAPSKPRAQLWTHPLSLNTWYHFCMMYDGTTMYGFVDGILVGSWAPTHNAVSNSRHDAMDGVLAGRTTDYSDNALTSDTFTDQIRLSNGLRYALTGFTVPAGVFVLD